MTLYANLHICSLILPSCHVKGDTANELHPYVSICSIMDFTCIFLMGLNGGKESWKHYHIYLLWQHSGRCGLAGHVLSVYALYLSLINALLLSAVIHTSEQRWGLTQCASGFLLWFQGPKGLESASSGLCLAGAGRCSKKKKKLHTKTNGCQSVFLLLLHSSFGSPLLVSTVHFWTKGSSKLCFSAGRSLHSFFPDESLRFRCRAVMGVRVGSLWPPSMWLTHPTNLCHRIIVFRWSVQWQMTCDQFNHNAVRLSWEMEQFYFIRWKTEWTRLSKSNVLTEIWISVLTKGVHILIDG